MERPKMLHDHSSVPKRQYKCKCERQCLHGIIPTPTKNAGSRNYMKDAIMHPTLLQDSIFGLELDAVAVHGSTYPGRFLLTVILPTASGPNGTVSVLSWLMVLSLLTDEPGTHLPLPQVTFATRLHKPVISYKSVGWKKIRQLVAS